MKATSKAVVGVTGVVLLLLVFLTRLLLDLGDQYSAYTYVQSSLTKSLDSSEESPADGISGDDKVVVMAKTEKENTDWVAGELPSWQRAIYVVNPSKSSSLNNTLHTPLNKGHEAMAYLTYIIDNYAALPSIMAFIHPHRSGFLTAWHTDTPSHSNVESLNSLQLPFVQANGFANLRCNHNPGCLQKHTKNQHVTTEIWHELFSGTSTGKTGSQEAPDRIGAACCAQFAVSRSQVLQRPLSDYQYFRQWIIDTHETDRKSGRVFEFLWHVVFGMQPV